MPTRLALAFSVMAVGQLHAAHARCSPDSLTFAQYQGVEGAILHQSAADDVLTESHPYRYEEPVRDS